MKVGGQILWNAIPICETSQTCCLMGRRPMKDVLGSHLKDLLFLLVHVEESYPTPHIHEQMTTSNYGYDTAYNFTHNNIMLEPNAMNNIDTVAHMNVHNTQY